MRALLENMYLKVYRGGKTLKFACEFDIETQLSKVDDLVIIISQSENGRQSAALRLAKSWESRTLAIVNVGGSSVSKRLIMSFILMRTEIGLPAQKLILFSFAFIFACVSLLLRISE
jgi:glucosamine 6-phosphate synthetase-like amidotransferase/phosphosugar isomerase protein